MKSYLSAIIVALLINNVSKVEALKIEQNAVPKTQTIKMNLVQSARLSDQMKSLSAKLPETKVLETKLSDMMKLQPTIQKTLTKLDHLTTIPEKPLIDAKKAGAKAAVKAIEKATDGKSTKSKKSSKSSSSSSSEDKSSTATEKALAKLAKISEKVDSSDNGLPSLSKKSSKKEDTASDIKKAISDIAETSSDALLRMNKNVDDSSVNSLVSSRVCKAGEDEVFDNCVPAESKREWNDVDQSDIKENNKKANSREFGDAASELIAKVNKKVKNLDAEDTKEVKEDDEEEEKPKEKETEGKEVDDVEKSADKAIKKLTKNMEKSEKKSKKKEKEEEEEEKPKKKKLEGLIRVEPSANAVEETVCEAEEVVKKAQEKADKVLEKVAEKKEAAPNGVIDVFARVLGDNAKKQASKDDMRSKLETAIMTRAAATDAKIDTTRDSLTAGLKETDKNTIPVSEKTLDAMANLAKEQVTEATQESLNEDPLKSALKKDKEILSAAPKKEASIETTILDAIKKSEK